MRKLKNLLVLVMCLFAHIAMSQGLIFSEKNLERDAIEKSKSGKYHDLFSGADRLKGGPLIRDKEEKLGTKRLRDCSACHVVQGWSGTVVGATISTPLLIKAGGSKSSGTVLTHSSAQNMDVSREVERECSSLKPLWACSHQNCIDLMRSMNEAGNSFSFKKMKAVDYANCRLPAWSTSETCAEIIVRYSDFSIRERNKIGLLSQIDFSCKPILLVKDEE